MTEFFPQELVDAIIDEVHDFADLKACSLTCRNFSSRSHSLLFQKLNLNGKFHLDAFQRFHDLCIESSHIPPLVRILCIHEYYRGSALSDRPKSDIVNSLLRLMQNLEVIKFYNGTSFVDFCDGSLARFSSHSFREVHLYDIFFVKNRLDQMCAMLQGSPKLERLVVHHTGPYVLPMFGGDETSQSRLEHIHVTRRGPLIQNLSVMSRPSYRCPAFIEAILETKTCPISINELHQFAFSLSDIIDFQHLDKMLALTSDTLRVPSLTFNCPNALHSHPLDRLSIVRMGHLRKITFVITHGLYGFYYLRWWIQSLKRVIASDGKPALRIMDIELGHSFSLVHPALHPERNKFDMILASLPFDDAFQMLTIKENQWDQGRLPWSLDNFPCEPWQSLEVRAEDLKTQLPRLAAKGKLLVKVI
ncbi:uncharacterized protein EV420DRAFT_1525706 [Desarmillaria tabescens]|uniref:F-box domain-containing protein n=1 Tax=Armillaria tabescens TaxID=1929756 RepID=A0AA39NBI0_ARMTA|nr:uncharacterized protein EV420DRAFT_1525706 [Desarmillaria tabescens]KAK0462577.1 hypothetical protein EV420DRAFT_1525706 [Desarmillaria tabescens]